MDWAKAKTILIIALLVICMLLGGILVARNTRERIADKQAAQNAVDYLMNQGASSICDIPLSRPSLPVLFIHFNQASLNRSVNLEEYKGIKLVAPGQPGYLVELSSAGKSKAKIITASSAVLKAAYSAGKYEGLEIQSIELVYYVDPEGFNPQAEDTALPCWAVKTNYGTYYINAYDL